MKYTLAIIIGIFFIALTPHANADSLIGDEINVASFFPDINSENYNLGTQVITSSGNTFVYGGALDLNISNSNITITFISDAQFTYATFNGLVITDLTKNFSNAYHLDSSSNLIGFHDSQLSTAGNTISLNFSGLTHYTGNFISISTPPTAVPEAGEWAMLLLGLPLLGWVVRRKQS